jgi:hypothetical protein
LPRQTRGTGSLWGSLRAAGQRSSAVTGQPGLLLDGGQISLRKRDPEAKHLLPRHTLLMARAAAGNVLPAQRATMTRREAPLGLMRQRDIGMLVIDSVELREGNTHLLYGRVIHGGAPAQCQLASHVNPITALCCSSDPLGDQAGQDKARAVPLSMLRIAPGPRGIVGGNTQSAAFVIAERLASWLTQTYRTAAQRPALNTLGKSDNRVALGQQLSS